jgi:hypothetical protein
MNRTAPSKRALVKAGNEAADRLIALVGACEFCKRTYGRLTQHEISRGSACRLKARLDQACCLVVCDECHRELHDLPKRTQVLVGLAILYHARGSDYSLARFTAIECPTAPNRYTQRDVDHWIDRLTRHA